MNIGTFWDNRTLIENFCSNILSSSGNSGMSITFAPNKITPFGAISYIAIILSPLRLYHMQKKMLQSIRLHIGTYFIKRARQISICFRISQFE